MWRALSVSSIARGTTAVARRSVAMIVWTAARRRAVIRSPLAAAGSAWRVPDEERQQPLGERLFGLEVRQVPRTLGDEELRGT